MNPSMDRVFGKDHPWKPTMDRLGFNRDLIVNAMTLDEQFRLLKEKHLAQDDDEQKDITRTLVEAYESMLLPSGVDWDYEKRCIIADLTYILE